MPQETLTLDDLIKASPPTYGIDDLIKSSPRTYTPDQIDKSNETAFKKRRERDKKNLLNIIGNVVAQAGYGLAEGATFGLFNPPINDQPEGTAEGIAKSVGNLGGLFVGPGKVLKPVQAGLRGLVRAPIVRGSQALLGAKAGKIAGALASHMVEETAGMTLLGALSDIDAPKEEMAQNMKDFGIMGGIFGAAKMIEIPKHAVLSAVLRQGGGRALMAAAGQYGKGYLDKENIPNVVWQEALNTFFLRRGITPHEIITGQYKVPENAKIVNDITDALITAQAPKSTDPIQIARSIFVKPKRVKVPFSEIEIDMAKVNEADRMSVLQDLQHDKPRKPRVRLYWDDARKKYITQLDDSKLAALRDDLFSAHKKGERLPVIDADVMTGPRAKETLIKPMELAYKLIGADKMDMNVIRHFQDADKLVMQVTPRGYKPISIFKSNETGGPATLGEGQVLFQKVGKKLVATSVSSDLQNKIVSGGKYVPQHEVFRKISTLQNEVDATRELIKNLDPDTARKAAFQLKMKEGKLNKLRASLEAKTELTGEPLPDSKGFSFDYKVSTGKKKAEDVGWEEVEEFITKQKTVDLDKLTKSAEKAYNLVKRMPEQRMPEGHLNYIHQRFYNLRMGPTDVKSFYDALKIKGIPKLKHLALIEEKLRALEQAPEEARMGMLLENFNNTYDTYYENLTGELASRQDAAEVWMGERRKRLKEEAYREFAKDTTSGSPLSKVITQKLGKSIKHYGSLGTWGDVRYTMMYIEEMTGLPMHRIYRQLSNGAFAKQKEHGDVTKKIVQFHKAPAEDQEAVRRYYAAKYNKDYVAPESITPYQQEFINAIDEMMATLKHDVFNYRWKMWVEHVKEPQIAREMEMASMLEKGAKKLEAKKDPKVFRSQNDPEIKKHLDMMYDAWMQMKHTGDSTAFESLVAQAELKWDLFGVREGAYLPEIWEGYGKSGLSNRELAMHADVMNKTHTKIRTGKNTEVDLDQSIVDQLRARKNLALELSDYASQILNLKHLGTPLRALDELVSMFYKDFYEAKPQAITRSGKEAKSYSVGDMMMLYASRLKGFPVKIGGLGRALKATQDIFFRSLVVRPMLIIRNFPQRIVTALNKSFVLDPRYWGKKYHFNNLPEDVKLKFDIEGVNEIDMMKNEYLRLATEYKIEKIPILRTFWKAAERVGSLYALSDLYNRRYVFSKTYFKTKDLIDSYQKGQIDLKTMENKAAIHKMRPLEQREFREAIQLGDPQQAAFVNARFQTVNSQWYYARRERSLQEMTAEGETYTNLLTWSKSMVQQTLGTYERFEDGWKRYKILKSQGKTGYAKEAQRQMFDAGAQMVGVMLTGYVANELLNTISMNHRGKYQAYGLDMFTWEMGGVTQEILTQFSSTMSNLVSAADGTPAERKKAIDDALKMVDNVGIRQLIPFAKSTLSVIESMTGRSYISPLKEQWDRLQYGYNKGQTFVDRTFIERMLHGIAATDPSKSADVRKFTFQHLQDLKREYATTKIPIYRERLWALIKKYEYLNEMFQRYEPHVSAKTQEQADLMKDLKSYETEQAEREYKMNKMYR